MIDEMNVPLGVGIADELCYLEEWEQHSPDTRSNGIIRRFLGGARNRFNVEPTAFEQTDSRCEMGDKISTGWKQYKCHCRADFWSREEPVKVQGCPRCIRKDTSATPAPAEHVKRSRLQLEGMRIGSLFVEGRAKGQGWVVRCDCGRRRYILGGTALARGAYQTCGQCKERERVRQRRVDEMEGIAAAQAGIVLPSMAPPSALRAPVVAALSARLDNARIIGTAIDRGEFTECSLDHAPILYDPVLHPDGCPVCLRSAQIELQSM